MPHTLPELPFEYDSLEPYMDKETLVIHHDKHHQAYVNKLNAALEGNTELLEKDIKEILENLESIPSDIKTPVTNHGGGHFNHTFFWTILKKDTEFSGEVAEKIKEDFGSYDKFKEAFSNSAATLFGSGWAWLVINKEGKLEILQTKDQVSPVSSGLKPLLVIDVWEHAYYLKYQNRRPEYIEAFFNLINWEQVNEYYLEAKS
ncbi:MAG: superoxide dismutase [Candidatus Nanoarchaeia archaeon]